MADANVSVFNTFKDEIKHKCVALLSVYRQHLLIAGPMRDQTGRTCENFDVLVVIRGSVAVAACNIRMVLRP